MSEPENPSAFPRTGEGFGNPHYDEAGMTLRDWFAGQALVGLVTRSNNARFNAMDAYEIADAMLVERSKP